MELQVLEQNAIVSAFQTENGTKSLFEKIATEAHKKKICNEALQGLMRIGVSEELGKQILQAIHKGEVPHVSIKF